MPKMTAPNYATGKFTTQDGTEFVPNQDGTLEVPLTHIKEFTAMGFTPVQGAAGGAPTDTSMGRPTTAVPGQMTFDGTIGKPIWRNAANNAWVDATGATV